MFAHFMGNWDSGERITVFTISQPKNVSKEFGFIF